jgi:hypothetical protein
LAAAAAGVRLPAAERAPILHRTMRSCTASKKGNDASMPRVPQVDDDLEAALDEEFGIGMTDVHSRTSSESDVVVFRGISGDTDPIDPNREYAARARLRGPFAPGMLPAPRLRARPK